MDQLIEQITQRTGISDDQARAAVGMVLEFVKSRLPAPLAAQLSGLLDGSAQAPGQANDIAQQALGNIGGLFGK